MSQARPPSSQRNDGGDQGQGVREDDANWLDEPLRDRWQPPPSILESMVDPLLNRRITILGDGTITLPLLGQVPAAERTLAKLKEESNQDSHTEKDCSSC